MIGLSLRGLLQDERGTTVIETAIVAPVLVVLSLGTFEAGSIVTRQTELQSAAAEAVAIVMAATPRTQAQVDEIEAAVEKSSGLAPEDVSFAIKIRCGTEPTLIDKTALDVDTVTCGDEDLQSWFLQISMSDHYTPTWTQFGVGSPLDYNVQRWVQLK